MIFFSYFQQAPNETFLRCSRIFFLFASLTHCVCCFFFSARVSYHSAVCSSLSIAINHFDTHTPQIHTANLFVVFFFALLFVRYTHAHQLFIWCAPIQATHVHRVRATRGTEHAKYHGTTDLSVITVVVFAFIPLSLSCVRLCKNNFCVWALRDAMTD